MTRSLAAALLVLSAAVPARAGEPPAPPPGDEDYVRLVLETPAPTPFSVVRYEVSRRGRATTAVHRRQLPGHGEPLHGMGLLTPEESEAVWALAVACDAAALPDRAAPPAGRAAPWPGLTWRVELSVAGRTHAFRVTDPDNAPDRRYARLVDGVREVVERVAGDQPFRNVFFPASALGWVNLVSVPVARVWVDGFDTGLETPLYGYELAAGAHTVRLVTADGALDREYAIRVEPSGTTHLTVDLR